MGICACEKRSNIIFFSHRLINQSFFCHSLIFDKFTINNRKSSSVPIVLENFWGYMQYHADSHYFKQIAYDSLTLCFHIDGNCYICSLCVYSRIDKHVKSISYSNNKDENQYQESATYDPRVTEG